MRDSCHLPPSEQIHSQNIDGKVPYRAFSIYTFDMNCTQNDSSIIPINLSIPYYLYIYVDYYLLTLKSPARWWQTLNHNMLNTYIHNTKFKEQF